MGSAIWCTWVDSPGAARRGARAALRGAAAAVGPGGGGYQNVLVSMPWISDLSASNIGSLYLEYRICMSRISDLYASNIESLCLEYRISALNIGSLCLEYWISMPRMSNLYASNIRFLCLEYTYLNTLLQKIIEISNKLWNRPFTNVSWMPSPFRIQCRWANWVNIC